MTSLHHAAQLPTSNRYTNKEEAVSQGGHTIQNSIMAVYFSFSGGIA
jgi:hypothetical protein